jgi:hypothetical protein
VLLGMYLSTVMCSLWLVAVVSPLFRISPLWQGPMSAPAACAELLAVGLQADLPVRRQSMQWSAAAWQQPRWRGRACIRCKAAAEPECLKGLLYAVALQLQRSGWSWVLTACAEACTHTLLVGQRFVLLVQLVGSLCFCFGTGWPLSDQFMVTFQVQVFEDAKTSLKGKFVCFPASFRTALQKASRRKDIAGVTMKVVAANQNGSNKRELFSVVVAIKVPPRKSSD